MWASVRRHYDRGEDDPTADGLTQRQVAEALGVSPRQAKRIEDQALRKLAILLRWYRITQEDLPS
jgi:transcriptional regulator with XRE-family HTH domain